MVFSHDVLAGGARPSFARRVKVMRAGYVHRDNCDGFGHANPDERAPRAPACDVWLQAVVCVKTRSNV